MFLDSTLLRGESFENMNRQQLAIIQARADLIDNHILSKLHGGAGQSVAATAVWGNSSDDPEADIMGAMDKIFENGRVNGNEPMLSSCLLRADSMMNTRLYTNLLQSLQERINSMVSLDVLYTRDFGSGKALGSDALLLIKGAQTAEFFTYNGDGFQETELTRIEGVGFSWLLTSYMGTVIHEHQGRCFQRNQQPHL